MSARAADRGSVKAFTHSCLNILPFSLWCCLLACLGMLAAMPQTASAASPEEEFAVPLNDAELAEFTAGATEVNLKEFDVTIQDNTAGMFTLDIAQSAFDNAQGIFTTLQTVNSAVDMTLIVNIYFTQGS